MKSLLIFKNNVENNENIKSLKTNNKYYCDTEIYLFYKEDNK